MSVEFVLSARSPEQFPRDGLPEIAFIGRSNVGKSSLLNALLKRGKKRGGALDRKQLAATSRTPGRTQAINFFRVNSEMYFADLPGYGYAKAPRREMEEWRKLAESYLSDRGPLRLAVLIVDIRHGATPLDEQMKQWLLTRKIRFLVVASKSDKLKKSQLARAVRSIEDSFHPPVAFSSVTGEGVGAVWDGVRKSIEL